MDKQTSDTLKIKINGKERPLTKDEESSEEISFSTWDEKLDAKKEIATAKQPVENEDDFPWILPDEEDKDFEEDPKVVTPIKKKKMFSNQTITPYHYSNKNNRTSNNISFPLKRILIIFSLAIGLGVLFGYIALNFLSNKDMPATGAPSEVINSGTVEEENSINSNENTEDKPVAGSSSTAPLQLFAVQGGIFSAKAGAETVATDIKEKGLASVVIESDGSYTVFAGIGNEKAETNELNEIYKQNNFQDFWGGKQISLTISTSSTAEKWASSIQELSSLSSATASGKSVNQDDVSSIESVLKDLKANGDTEKASIEKLLQAIKSIKNNDGWEAQQNLLEVISKLSSN